MDELHEFKKNSKQDDTFFIIQGKPLITVSKKA